MPSKLTAKPTEKINTEELLAKANEPKKFAMKYHPFYRGKIEMALKAPVRTNDDFSRTT